MNGDEIVGMLRREIPGLATVYLFGSTVDGSERPDSDIDVAFVAKSAVESVRRFAIQELLAVQLHRNVDLVDLWNASTVMRMQVITKGRLLFDLDPSAREAFEDYVFSSYARLNEERRDILRQIAHEGRIYGG